MREATHRISADVLTEASFLLLGTAIFFKKKRADSSLSLNGRPLLKRLDKLTAFVGIC